MNQLLEEKYKELGISEKVYAFGEKIEQELKERFEKIDANAEYNQMKVIAAMQKNRVPLPFPAPARRSPRYRRWSSAAV